jgi:cardiolipin synthase
VLGEMPTGPLLTAMVLLVVLAAICFLWPAWIAWPVGVMAAWTAVHMSVRAWRLHKRRREFAGK